MKLLILTQIVDLNDDVLGFMHGWLAEFAKNCERVTVICLKKGEISLPANVKVLSLGKEENNFQFSIFNFQLKKIKYFFRFYKYLWRERKNYDKVFVHMNYEYAILGGIFWRLLGKKIGLWYAHGRVPFGLKIAEKLVNIILTSTTSGCRLKSRKINVIGQGIDAGELRITNYELRIKNRNKIISIGRISPSKDYATLIKAVEILKNKGLKLSVEIIGRPAVKADEDYFRNLRQQVAEKKLAEEIKFIGPVANKEILKFLQNAGLFVNMGQTGSLDKALVEAMAVELPVLTCNEAMLEVLGDYKEVLMYPKKDFKKLAERIEYIINLPAEDYIKLGRDLRSIVIEKHNLDKFIIKIAEKFNYGIRASDKN